MNGANTSGPEPQDVQINYFTGSVQLGGILASRAYFQPNAGIKQRKTETTIS